MTTNEAIYKTALEQIKEGADAVCVDCGWIGTLEEASNGTHMVCPLYGCPVCTENYIRGGADEISRYVLGQVEKSEKKTDQNNERCRICPLLSPECGDDPCAMIDWPVSDGEMANPQLMHKTFRQAEDKKRGAK